MSETTPEAHGQLTVVVPALNEAEALPATLQELMAVCEPRGWAVIVVDDGSSDDTSAVAEAGGATVIRHKVRRGYGWALKSGIRAASTPYVVSFDADGQHDAADLAGLLEAAIETDADLVVGHRQGGSGRYRSLGKLMIRTITRILMPNPITDSFTQFLRWTARRGTPLRPCPSPSATYDRKPAYSGLLSLSPRIFRRRVLSEIPRISAARP